MNTVSTPKPLVKRGGMVAVAKSILKQFDKPLWYKYLCSNELEKRQNLVVDWAYRKHKELFITLLKGDL